MCGFALVVLRDKPTFPINEKILANRGPDNTQEVDLGWARLRHWRLSVQDLSSVSNQPLHDEEHCLAYNGEIYDFNSLGHNIYNKNFKSDTHLLFHSLKNHDFEKLKFESGFYSFVFINKINRTFFATRDFFGKKPLYFYFDKKILIVASQEDSIRTIHSEYFNKLPIDSRSIGHYLLFKDLHFGATFIRGITELAPGSTLSFDRNNWTINVDKNWKKYYQEIPFYKNLNNFTGEKYTRPVKDKKDFRKEISKTIQKRFVADIPIQLALSGGIDSTIVALEAANTDAKVLRAITIASNSRPSEQQKSSTLCDKVELKHTVIDFNTIDVFEELKSAIQAQGGPLSHPHALAYNIIAKTTRKQGKVLVTGEGADELFFGYEHYKHGKESSFAFMEHINFTEFFDYTSDDNNLLKGISEKILNFKCQIQENDGRDLDVKTHLLSLLRRNDRISMFNSVELRSAFLDPKLFVSSYQLLSENKLEKGKNLLLDMIADLGLDYEADKEKIGFYVPFDDWFEDEFRINKELQKIVKNAVSFIELHFGLKFKSNLKIKRKLAWALLNIGIFLHLEEATANE